MGDGVLVTETLLAQRRKQFEEVDRQRSELAEEVHALEVVLSMRKTILSETANAPVQSQTDLGERTKKILEVLRESNSSLSPKQIRARLTAAGNVEIWGKGWIYYYQRLKRLTDGGKIHKVGKKYLLTQSDK